MSKVIHLADSAHAQAKTYCKENGLKMSDWVASLIGVAVRDVVREEKAVPAPVAPPAETARKKRLPTFELEADELASDDSAMLSRPPFWAKQATPAPQQRGDDTIADVAARD